jgi:hypothetical protein
MHQKLYFSVLFIFFAFVVYGQNPPSTTSSLRISIGKPTESSLNQPRIFRGTVKAENGTLLEGINLLFPALKVGTITNNKGF